MRAVLLLMLLLFIAPTNADEKFSNIEVCRDFSVIAKDIMVARQKDRPMSETLPVAIDRLKQWADKIKKPLDDEFAEEWAAELVMAAYDRPSFGDPKNSRNAQHEISEFENTHFEDCYKAGAF